MSARGQYFTEEYFEDLGPQSEWKFSTVAEERAYRRELAEAAESKPADDATPPVRAMTDEEFEAAQRGYVERLSGEAGRSPFWK